MKRIKKLNIEEIEDLNEGSFNIFLKKNSKEKIKFKKMENFKPRIKARIRRSKIEINKNVKNIFDWIKGAEIIELDMCNTDEDPVRPELSNDFRTSYGGKYMELNIKMKYTL